MKLKLITSLLLIGVGMGLGCFSAWSVQQHRYPNLQSLNLNRPLKGLAQRPDATFEVIAQQAAGVSQNQLCAYTVNYPQVKLSANSAVEAQINTYLKQQFFQSEIEYLQPFDLESCAAKMTGLKAGLFSYSEVIKYSVEFNQKGILSLRYYALQAQKSRDSSQPNVSFYTPTKALTLDLQNGRAYTYDDLFLPGSDIHQRIQQRIRQQYGITPGDGRHPAPDTYAFYLDQRGLVLFNLFPQRSLAAAHLVISPAEMADAINPQGPLKVFLP